MYFLVILLSNTRLFKMSRKWIFVDLQGCLLKGHDMYMVFDRSLYLKAVFQSDMTSVHT